MNFEKRNDAWGGEERAFVQSQTRSSAPRIWRVRVDGDLISYAWGQMNGALQTATERGYVVNQGKKNEVSAVDYALYLAREKARKKHWEGYREVDAAGNYLDALSTEIDFDNLPLNLSFYKPANNLLECKGLFKKAQNGKVWYTRKRDGNAMILARGQGPVKMYSRRMLRQMDKEEGSPFTWDDRFTKIVAAANAVMPPNSIVLGELVMSKGNGLDDPPKADSLLKSLTPQALQDIAQHGEPEFYVWDVAFWDGVDLVREAPVRQRYELIHTMLCLSPFAPIQFYAPSADCQTPETFRELAKKLGWEGWVVVDPDGVYGDRGYNFKGKPDRPANACAKLKPVYEDDFIVFWDPTKGYGEYSSKGRYGDKGMESACLYQLNAKGEMVYISNVASGLTEEMKSGADPSQFPQVWVVEYTDRRYKSRGDKTNSLDFPRFLRIRGDKRTDECVNQEL